MSDNKLAVELANRLSNRVVIASDISDADIQTADMQALSARVESFFAEKKGVAILTKQILNQIIEQQKEEKIPTHVEVSRSSDFKPMAKDVEKRFSVREARIDKTGGTTSDFTEHFRDRFNKLRRFVESNRSIMQGMLRGIDAVKQYADGKEVGIIGMVYDKIITKKGNILVTVEDENGTAKVLFVKSESIQGMEIFENAKRLVNDDVIAVKGKLYSKMVIVNSMMWPDVPIHAKKQTESDIAVALMSDVHVGSKLFMEKNFGAMLKWLNGGTESGKELAGKVKYIVFNGDVADGIGVYPGQDKDLAVLDIYKQYSIFFDFLYSIPEYIEVFVLPGNHDAVQRAEPQPPLSSELIGQFAMDNVHIVSNPSTLEIEGLKVLAYHGTSLDSVIQNIPGCSYAKPETAMTEILKRRHLSPIYGGNIIVPSKNDALVIDEVPDILHMGHVHKNGVSDYHGTLIINSGTWQGRTAFQIKQGHIPTPGIVPVYEGKSMRLTNVDFNSLS
ncbi:MAG: DNA-directed DNA polymerase II small subunit [Candidatus Micrarchaeota archaeon]|nr:DNA-directed DNA polymerase II small subunit [Candidatus Micrarchaeota archaeon]MDE1804537.1 DNA-directed DNA polymerase II small subunit [Candidatus Micrarchaeota archaeon]MDE1846907.1 DNA-directed DNA polymerase II small subunit [Candidatus Micrarchaeota archaeon]